MVKIAVSLTVAIFYENPKNGQCSGHCGLKMASGERVKNNYSPQCRQRVVDISFLA